MSYAKQKVLQTEGESYLLKKFFQGMKLAEITNLISQKRNKIGFMLLSAAYGKYQGVFSPVTLS